jgi:multiple sugar transport system substrate-binding protein
MFKASKAKPEAFNLIAFLSSPKNNIEWEKFVGVLPIHNGANNDPFFASEQFAGWFEELKNPDRYQFVAPPSHLENLGQFFDQMAPKGLQQVLLGQRPAAEVTAEWAKFLTAEQKAWMAKQPH